MVAYARAYDPEPSSLDEMSIPEAMCRPPGVLVVALVVLSAAFALGCLFGALGGWVLHAWIGG